MKKLIAILLLLAVAPMLGAQDFVKVKGVVVSTSGTPIAGAAVTAVGTRIMAKTDAAGAFELMIPGTVRYVRVQKPMFLAKNVRVGPSLKITLEKDTAAPVKEPAPEKPAAAPVPKPAPAPKPAPKPASTPKPAPTPQSASAPKPAPVPKPVAAPKPIENPEDSLAVDLGLSVKWASCNLGAEGFVSSPEEYGVFYAWGETEAKSDYGLSSYSWFNESSSALTKYNTKSVRGAVDNITVLETGPRGDDAASKKLKGKWRLPTDEEWTELREKCTWEWTAVNGVYGRKITSSVQGYTDKWIFLPAAGFQDGAAVTNAGALGYYWSSSLCKVSPFSAWLVYFDADNVMRNASYRQLGFSVRPVMK